MKKQVNRQKRRRYEGALAVAREVIGEWDPYGLLAGGAPADEFDAEAAAVAAQLGRIASPADAAHVVSRVFSSSFEAYLFGPEACREVGERLYQRLRERGFLPGG